MTVFYFTTTGNSLYVAKRIGGKAISIAQALKEETRVYKDDAIGFVFPCYGFGIPKIVKKIVEQSRFKADYCFAVMTYGNITANGLSYMEKAGERAGIKFNYTAEILMVDNYLPVYKIEEQLKNEAGKKIEAKLCSIVEEVSNRMDKKVHKGWGNNTASMLIQMMEPLRKGDTDKKFSVSEKCTQCGICKMVCPKGNISVNEKVEYLHDCDFCMGCINICPQNAIHLKGEKSSVRFINRNVTVKELIAANNQQSQ